MSRHLRAPILRGWRFRIILRLRRLRWIAQLVINIHGIYASIAASYARIDDAAKAAEVFETAIAAALELEGRGSFVYPAPVRAILLIRHRSVLDDAQRARMRAAYKDAGPEAVSGFRKVLEAMMDPEMQRAYARLRDNGT